jgi:hypothetical protein
MREDGPLMVPQGVVEKIDLKFKQKFVNTIVAQHTRN